MDKSSSGKARQVPAISLRPASSGDAMLLYGWLNRPDRIASSLQTSEPVPLERHLAWLGERLADPDCRIWILDTADGPSGQLRLQDGAAGAEVSIYVAPEFRGRGIAAGALAAAAEHCRHACAHGRLLARVRRDNAASAKLFATAGFVVIEEFSDHFLLALDSLDGPHEADPA